MNLKLVRNTRTASSEEISIYDVDTRDANDSHVKLGKIDVHYVEDQIVGTLLIWHEYAEGYRRSHTPGIDVTLDEVIDAILTEISEPVGVSATYAVEVYYPPMSGASEGPAFVSNYPDDEESDGSDTETDDSYLTDSSETEPEDRDSQGEAGPGDNDFANRLRQHP